MFDTEKIGCCGRFKFEVRKAGTDELVQETDWVDNIVLNGGLDMVFDKNPYTGILVGTGNSTPVATQTALDTQVAASNTQQGSDVRGYVESPTNPYSFYRRKSRINAGVLNNVAITEVAMHTKNVLFNRALIKDSQGNPTSITVQNDEYLDITGEVRMYFNNALHTGSFNLTDKNNNLIKTVNYKGRFARAADSDISRGMSSGGTFFFMVQGYGGLISEEITGNPTGTRHLNSSDGWESSYAYVPGSHRCQHRVVVPLDSANNVAIKSLWVSYAGLEYQFEFDEPIMKTADETLTMAFNLNWGRYTGVIE